MHYGHLRARVRRASGAERPSRSADSGSGTQPSTSNRHRLMRQQFYSNNDRSRGASRAAAAEEQNSRAEEEEEEQVRGGRHLELLSESSSLSASQRTEPDGGRTPRFRSQFSGDNSTAAQELTGTTNGLHGDNNPSSPQPASTASSVQQQQQLLPKECLQQYNPAYHSASPSMPASGGLVDLLSSHGNYAPNSNSSGGSYNSTGFSEPLLIDCDANQLASLMDDRTRELNFSDNEQVWLVKSWPEILARVSFVAPIVLLGLIGNLTIIYSMCRFKPIRSKPTNIFILNMALADLLTTIVCPNAALFTDIFQFYVMGALVCRMEGFIKITCLLVSAYSLIVLSFDWCLSVVRPCRTRISIGQAWLTLAVIWLVSLAMASPLLHWRRLRERQWKDLVEVWCRELIQYTKYYWVCMTLFLIYLPTFVMTIVLIVILAQMDRFEAKLRRSRNLRAQVSAHNLKGAAGLRRSATSSGDGGGGGGGSPMMMMTMTQQHVNSLSGAGAPSSQSNVVSAVTGGHESSSVARISVPSGSGQQVAAPKVSASRLVSSGGERQINNSLSIGMKYRRRIVKILFFYLLTSIVCWTPLQFTIIYRHFRSEAVPAGWFFELTFYSQLSASLSAAMNPIIFGFLSQPFRRVVTKSWMFRFLDKVWATNARTKSDPGNNERAPAQPVRAAVQQQQQQQHRQRSPTVQQQRLEPRLTIDYVEHQPPRAQAYHQAHQRRAAPPSIKRSRSSTAAARQKKRVSFNSRSSQTNGGIENAAYECESKQQPDRTTSFIIKSTNGLKQTKN